MINYNVLLVEDCEFYQGLIQQSLSLKINLFIANSLMEGSELLHSNNSFDLIILDVNLPDGSGFDFFITIKNYLKDENIPIIFLTAKEEVESRVMGFTLGADDYIIKPFEPRELLARALCRIEKNITQKKVKNLIFGDIFIDQSKQIAQRTEGNYRYDILLTPKEYKILTFFIKNKEMVFSRAQMLDNLWPDKYHISDRNIDVHLSNIRRKMGSHNLKLQNITGIGYKLTLN